MVWKCRSDEGPVEGRCRTALVESTTCRGVSEGKREILGRESSGGKSEEDFIGKQTALGREISEVWCAEFQGMNTEEEGQIARNN